MLILSYENEFSFVFKLNSFSYERMSTKTRFEKEAKGNSEMAYFSVLSLNGLLVVYARSSSLDFDLVGLDFPPDFLKLFLLLQYLSIFSDSTLAGVSVYNQASTLDAQRKELDDRTDQKITNKISRTFLFRDYCAKRLGIEISNITATMHNTSFSRHFLTLHSPITG